MQSGLIRIQSFLIMAVLAFISVDALSGNPVTTPESHFGFKPGSDRKLTEWKDVVAYFDILQKESDRIMVMNMGPSTMGNPFLVVLISAPENLANLKRLQHINKAISDPRGIDASEIELLVAEGKAVICQSYGLHSSEVGGPQAVPGLTYDLLSRDDADTKRILDNVLFFMIPDFNPDGSIMIHDWYSRTLGSDAEGSGMPWLYHKYIGHDTNRDGDFLNMPESRYAAKIMYRDWPPQAYLDHHQMGSYGPRFFVPPYCEPIRPHADPLVWREISWYGAHIAYKLEEKGVQGVINSALFPGWGHFGWHWITPFHNIAGMLTESASARLASPLYIHPEQLKGESRGFPKYQAQSTFPSPWPGGWWRLEDIVRQKQIASRALLDLAARNRETVLRNAYQKALHQIDRGSRGEMTGIVIPAEQHDSLTVKKMINILRKSGIDILQAEQAFFAGRRRYQAGDFFISLAQPKQGLIRNLLMETHYADNDWTRDKKGKVMRPYDLSTHTMNEFMGVCADPVNLSADDRFTPVDRDLILKGSVLGTAQAYRLDGRLNDSFRAVNLLLEKGIFVARVHHPTAVLAAGDFIVRCVDISSLSTVAEESGVDFLPLEPLPQEDYQQLKPKRIGIYQRYWGGNMDEGWTRFLLEQYDFPFHIMRDAPFAKGKLNQSFDIILFANDSSAMIRGKLSERHRRYLADDLPAEYQSGISDEGLENLRQFVRLGGTLVTMGEACNFAVETFKLQVRNVLDHVDSQQFFCSGSTLKAEFSRQNPLAWGLPEEGLVLFTDSPTFEVLPGNHNEAYQTVVRYKREQILQSGWLEGEKTIAGKSAMLTARYGRGRIVLIGFRTQHRAQTAGTFKFLFNSLL